MRNTVLFAALTLVIATGTGCDRVNSITDAAKTAAASVSTASADKSWDEKVQTYIRFGNSVRRFVSSDNQTFAAWRERDEKKVAAGDFKAIRTDVSSFDAQKIEELKKAIAMPGKTPELDTAANALLAALDKGMPAWEELVEYNKAKRFEDDGGAKGKSLLPAYREGIASIKTAVIKLSDEIDKASKLAHEKTLAKYKADGKLLEMHTLEGMGAAEKIVDMFNTEADFKDEAKLQQANALIAAVEASAKSITDEHAKRKALGDEKSDLPRLDSYDDVVDSLNTFAGHYREARKDPEKFNDAVKEYNDMVDSYNRMSR